MLDKTPRDHAAKSCSSAQWTPPREDRGKYLLSQLQHDIGNFDIFPRLIFDCHFKDDVLLMIRDRLLADRLNKLAQPVKGISSIA